MENVPQVIGQKNIKDFQEWIYFLESKGYSNYAEVLNAKEVGYPEPIPQNRERCFMVSILGDYYYTFPHKEKLILRLKDMLEDEVDEKYYLSNKDIARISNWNAFEKPLENVMNVGGISSTPTTHAGKDSSGMKLIGIPNLKIKNATQQGYLEAELGDGIDISGRMESHRGTVQKGMAQTISTMGGNNVGVVVPNLKQEYCNKLIDQGLVKENDVIRHSYTNDRMNGNLSRTESKNNICPTLETRCDCLGVVVPLKRGYSCEVMRESEEPKNVDIIGNYSKSNYNQTSIVGKNGVAPTITENHGQVAAITETKVIGGIGEKKSNGGTQYYYQDRIYESDVANTLASVNPYYKNDLRIRKLTPCECWLLMGFDREDYIKASKVVSDAQLYKQAGNSIVVNVLSAIFKQML